MRGLKPINCIFAYKTKAGFALATDLCLSWPKVLNLVTVRGLMKTPVSELLEKYLTFFFS